MLLEPINKLSYKNINIKARWKLISDANYFWYKSEEKDVALPAAAAASTCHPGISLAILHSKKKKGDCHDVDKFYKVNAVMLVVMSSITRV